MNNSVKLLFGAHAHQPAGNFPEVVREAHEKCYRPFLEVLERHPDFCFAIHISGWLMEFLLREYPEDMARLRMMVARGQTEIFGGGDTEPVLAAIPDADRRTQIAALSSRINRRFKVRPHGAWLTERVWEATVVPALSHERIEYVVVDDYHFLCAGQPAERLDGHFSTEEDCCRLDLFPISESLRYKIPFAPVHDAIGYLENMPSGGAAIYFDDIEKFGIWPETYEWVYGRRWLEDFIEAVERSPSIQPMRYSDYHSAHRSRGIVYLPTVSYYEMSEWTLPARQAHRLAFLVERAKHDGTFDLDKVYLRGGQWRNFLSRYPESNWMHKRMEMVSSRLRSLKRSDRTANMQADLHLAQANDAYWHGLFGGVYYPHLRRQVYSAIARLEAALDDRARLPVVERIDLDFDDCKEVFLRSTRMLAVVKPNAGASLCELTHFGLAHNFADTLVRREEHYYETIRARVPSDSANESGIASIHDRVAYRTTVREDDLAPDRHPRTVFLDFWRPLGQEGEARIEYDALPIRGAAAKFLGNVDRMSILKRFRVSGRGPTVSYEMKAASDVIGIFIVELNLAMPSCDGPGGAYFVDRKRIAGFGDRFAVPDCTSLLLADSELGGSVSIVLDAPADIVGEPHYTVSQSEAGFEKIWQAAMIRISFPVEIRAAESKRLFIRLGVSVGQYRGDGVQG
jgi:hypothetical protein